MNFDEKIRALKARQAAEEANAVANASDGSTVAPDLDETSTPNTLNQTENVALTNALGSEDYWNSEGRGIPEDVTSESTTDTTGTTGDATVDTTETTDTDMAGDSPDVGTDAPEEPEISPDSTASNGGYRYGTQEASGEAEISRIAGENGATDEQVEALNELLMINEGVKPLGGTEEEETGLEFAALMGDRDAMGLPPRNLDNPQGRDMVNDKDWMDANRVLIDRKWGEGTAARMTDQEINDRGRVVQSNMAYNSISAASYLIDAATGDEEYAKAALTVLEKSGQYEGNGFEFWEAVKNTLLDPVAWGSGTLATTVVRSQAQKAVVRTAMKEALLRTAAPAAAAGFTEGAIFGGLNTAHSEILTEKAGGEEASAIDIALGSLGIGTLGAAGGLVLGAPFMSKQFNALKKYSNSLADDMAKKPKADIDADAPLTTTEQKAFDPRETGTFVVTESTGNKQWQVTGYDNGWVRLVDADGQTLNRRAKQLSPDPKRTTGGTDKKIRRQRDKSGDGPFNKNNRPEDGTLVYGKGVIGRIRASERGYVAIMPEDGSDGFNIRLYDVHPVGPEDTAASIKDRLSREAAERGDERARAEAEELGLDPDENIQYVRDAESPQQNVSMNDEGKILDADTDAKFLEEASDAAENYFLARDEMDIPFGTDRWERRVSIEYDRIKKREGYNLRPQGEKGKAGKGKKSTNPQVRNREEAAEAKRLKHQREESEQLAVQETFVTRSSKFFQKVRESGDVVNDFFGHPITTGIATHLKRLKQRGPLTAHTFTPKQEAKIKAVESTLGFKVNRQWEFEEIMDLTSMHHAQIRIMQKLGVKINDNISSASGAADPILLGRMALEHMRLNGIEAVIKTTTRGPLVKLAGFGKMLANANGTDVMAEAFKNIIRHQGGEKRMRKLADIMSDAKFAPIGDKAGVDHFGSIKASQLSYVARQLRGTWWDTVIAFRYNFMLSSSSTHVANLMGSSTVAAMEGFRFGAAAGINYGEYMFRKKLTDAFPNMKGHQWNKVLPMEESERMLFLSPDQKYQAAQAAWRDIMNLVPKMLKGEAIDEADIKLNVGGKVTSEYNRMNAIKGDEFRTRYNSEDPPMLPIRLMEAMDTAFKAYHFRMSLHRQAKVKAQSKATNEAATLSGNLTPAQRINYWLKEPSPDMVVKANKEAARKTFTNDPTDYGGLIEMYAKTVSTLQHSHPIGNALAPFVNTPANIFGYAMEYTPLGTLSNLKKDVNSLLGSEKLQKWGKREGTDPTEFNAATRADFIARVGMATGTGYLVFEQWKQGRITGEGTGNWDIEKARSAQGIYPNSYIAGRLPSEGGPVKMVGDKKTDEQMRMESEYAKSYQLDRFEPLGLMINIWATTFDAFEMASDEETKIAILGAASLEIADMMHDRAWLNTFSRFLNVISDRSPTGFSDLGAGLVMSYVVPGQVRDWRKAKDPVVRSTTPNYEQGGIGGFVDKLRFMGMNAVPYFSEKLPGKVLWNGEIDTLGGQGAQGALYRAIVPLRMREFKADIGSWALYNARVEVSQPADTLTLDWASGTKDFMSGGASLNLRAMDEYGFVHQKYQLLVGEERKRMVDAVMKKGGAYESIGNSAVTTAKRRGLDEEAQQREQNRALGPNGQAHVLLSKMMDQGLANGRAKFLAWLSNAQKDGKFTVQDNRTIIMNEQFTTDDQVDLVNAIISGDEQKKKAIQERNVELGNQFLVTPPAEGRDSPKIMEQFGGKIPVSL